jgi:similar to stage IV sporulation protein
MKNQWLHFWVGKIHLKLTGEGIERFLNDCTRQDISVLNVQFKNEGEVRATFLLKDQKFVQSSASTLAKFTLLKVRVLLFGKNVC